METNHHNRAAFDRITSVLIRIEEQLKKGEVKFNWLDTPGTCKLLNITKRTLEHYRESGLLPYSKLGGKVYFRLPDIENYLAGNQVRKTAKS